MSTKITRPPVITVLGHVDHGKTSLLDRLRNANVAAGEAGGITQAIGAYQIEHQGKTLTFIDTPGHAAFSAMRARGGQVADVAILVVAADDGVMPQTKESLEHIQKAGIPFVIAINKVDLPDANVTKVKQGLAENGIYVEGYGGNTPVVEISAKTGAGFDQLLETILLLAELEELTDTSENPTAAIVIESQLHPQKGPLASLLIQDGVLKLKDDLYLGHQKYGKVKSLLTAKGAQIDKAPPATPVQVLGFTSVPPIGEIITTKEGEAVKTSATSAVPTTIEEVSDQIKPKIILKTDVAGSLEAIINSLPQTISVLSQSVGAPTESDIQLAVSNSATIVCFNLKVPTNVAKLSQVEKVEIATFKIIYELFDYLNELVVKVQKPAAPEPTGTAQVLKLFPFNNQTVYGCLVTSGKIKLGSLVQGSKIISIRTGKEVVKEAKKDQECGIIIEPSIELKAGDIIEAVDATVQS